MTPPREIHLNLLVSAYGSHVGAPQHAESVAVDSRDIDHYVRIAQTAERGTFDALFFADAPALQHGRAPTLGVAFEPTTLLGALAAHTTHLGLIATASTSFYEPYNLARLFASVDLISGGRAGWNAVTTANLAAAQNFGLEEHFAHADRYERAEEFIDVVHKLWRSWDLDAVTFDEASGQSIDPQGVRSIGHRGRHFAVHGALTVPPSPQGHPLQVQAGGSDAGIRLGARYADLVFANAHTLEGSLAFADELRAAAAALGRNPAHIAVSPGVIPFLGDTEDSAHRLKDELDETIDVSTLVPAAEHLIHVDLSGFDPDAPFPVDLLPDDVAVTNSMRAYSQIAADLRRGGYTVRRALIRVGGASIHREFIGTPEQFADDLEKWFRSGAADAFTLMPPLMPRSLDIFVDEVVPLLRARGLFREEYESTTLRGHYGLPVPGSLSPAATCSK